MKMKTEEERLIETVVVELPNGTKGTFEIKEESGIRRAYYAGTCKYHTIEAFEAALPRAKSVVRTPAA